MSTQRLHAADIAYAIAAIGAFAALLVLGRDVTFFGDEWAWIATADDLSLEALMRPHNEHWSLGWQVAYKGLLQAAGLDSYTPFRVLLLALHVATATAIYVYARRQAAPAIALAMALVFLLLGSGGTNLFWASLIDQSGSAAAGTWALVILLRDPLPRHIWLAASLLLVAVVMSGVGLFFLAAAAAALLVSPDRRRHLWVLLPASLAYAAWYLLYGQDAVRAIAAPIDVLLFTAAGIGNAFGQVSGLGMP